MGEDNLPDALLVKEAIRTENLQLQVYLAEDGERVVDFIARSEKDSAAPCPHVLLLDLNLPRISGFEVLLKIRNSEKYKNLPVIVVTSSDSPADRSRAAELGANYFRKPITYDEFLALGGYLRQFLQDRNMLS